MSDQTLQMISNGLDVSRSFKCRFWVQFKRRFQLAHARAPRQRWAFTMPKSGTCSLAADDSLTLSAWLFKNQQVSRQDVIGVQREILRASTQLRGILLETLFISSGVGLLISLLYLLLGLQAQRANFSGFINLFILCFGLVAGLCLLFALPALLRLRTLTLFTLHLSNDRYWDFAVLPHQADQVAALLYSAGIEEKS